MDTFKADYITKSQFAYTCPYCWNKYNRDGRPRKNAVNIQHRHGSCGNTSNREESRSSHCSIITRDVKILIDDDTIRK